MPKLKSLCAIITAAFLVAGCGDTDPLPISSTNVSFALEDDNTPTNAIRYATRAYRAIQGITSVQQIIHDLLAINQSSPPNYAIRENRCSNNTAGGIYSNDNEDSSVSVEDGIISEVFENCTLSSNGMRVDGVVRSSVSEISGTIYTVRVSFTNTTISPAFQSLSFTLNGSYDVQVDIGNSTLDSVGFSIERPSNLSVSTSGEKTDITSGSLNINYVRTNDSFNASLSTIMIFNGLSSEQINVSAQSLSGDISANALLHPITGGEIDISPVSSRQGDRVEIFPVDSANLLYEMRINYEGVEFIFPDRSWVEDEISEITKLDQTSLSVANAPRFISRSYNTIQALIISQQIIERTLSADSGGVCESGTNGGYESTPSIGLISQDFNECRLRTIGHTIDSGLLTINLTHLAPRLVDGSEEKCTNGNAYCGEITYSNLVLQPNVASNTSEAQYILNGSYDFEFELLTSSGFNSQLNALDGLKINMGSSEAFFVEFKSGTFSTLHSIALEEYQATINAEIFVDEDDSGDVSEDNVTRDAVNLFSNSTIIGRLNETPSRPIFPHSSGLFTIYASDPITGDSQSQVADADDNDGNEDTYERTVTENSNTTDNASVQQWSDL